MWSYLYVFKGFYYFLWGRGAGEATFKAFHPVFVAFNRPFTNAQNERDLIKKECSLHNLQLVELRLLPLRLLPSIP
jgi:hypothetical protein